MGYIPPVSSSLTSVEKSTTTTPPLHSVFSTYSANKERQRIAVYTGSSNHVAFYNMIYRQLIQTSSKERNQDLINKEIKPIILSRQFPLSFCASTLREDNFTDRVTATLQKMQEKIVDLADSDSSPSRANPLGLLDANSDLDEELHVIFNQKLVEFEKRSTHTDADKRNLRENIFFTGRYNLENYLFDPAFTFSLLNETDITEWFARDKQFIDHALACHKALKSPTIQPKALQSAFDTYFRYFIEQFVSIEVLNMENRRQFDATLPHEAYNKIFGYIKTLPVFFALSGQESVDVEQQLIKDLGLTFAHTMSGEEKRDQIVNELLKAHRRKTTLLLLHHNTEVSITYPGLFVYATGYMLEAFVQSTFAKNRGVEAPTFKKWLIESKIEATNEVSVLPWDLVNLIYRLNAQARQEGKKGMKLTSLKAGSSASAEV